MHGLFTNHFLIISGIYYVISRCVFLAQKAYYHFFDAYWSGFLTIQRLLIILFIAYFLKVFFTFRTPQYVSYLKVERPKTTCLLALLGFIPYWNALIYCKAVFIKLYQKWPWEFEDGMGFYDKILSLFTT